MNTLTVTEEVTVSCYADQVGPETVVLNVYVTDPNTGRHVASASVYCNPTVSASDLRAVVQERVPGLALDDETVEGLARQARGTTRAYARYEGD